MSKKYSDSLYRDLMDMA